MRELNGSEVASFIKQRQAGEVRVLVSKYHVHPKLAIVRTNTAPVVDVYMKLKKAYGTEVGVDVEVHETTALDAVKKIEQLNQDATVHGIVVQLPLTDPKLTDVLLNSVAAHKDVDGLAVQTDFDPATPTAILWLLAAYNIQLNGKNIVVMGQGRLVGAPLSRILVQSGCEVTSIDVNTGDIASKTKIADVIITAVGKPSVLTPDMIKSGVVIVDAGVATDTNGLVGDVDASVRAMDSVQITPQRGGVGPLTIAALFEHVITAAQKAAA